jgi:hypothetical protein
MVNNPPKKFELDDELQPHADPRVASKEEHQAKKKGQSAAQERITTTEAEIAEGVPPGDLLARLQMDTFAAMQHEQMYREYLAELEGFLTLMMPYLRSLENRAKRGE